MICRSGEFWCIESDVYYNSVLEDYRQLQSQSHSTSNDSKATGCIERITRVVFSENRQRGR